MITAATLAVAIGFALLGNGLGSRVWSLTLAALGLFYGLFGVLRLSVFLDIGLVGGAVALAAAAFPRRSPVARGRSIGLVPAATARHEWRHDRTPASDEALEATVSRELYSDGGCLPDVGGLLYG